MALFSAYEVTANSNIVAFFIESTAPDDIDEAVAKQFHTPDGTTPIDPDAAIDKIVNYLAVADNPSIVVAVHGFNSPRSAVLASYGKAFTTVSQDDPINASGVVCIGYRWPSESIGMPWRSALGAAPPFLLSLLGISLGILAGAVLTNVFNISWFTTMPQWLRALGVLFATAGATIPLALFILRVIVYFRDGYRATSYGIPDLVEIIRQIDVKLDAKQKEMAKNRRVALSFQGHSMGAYVVTSVVRILSDVFDAPAVPPDLTTSKPRVAFQPQTAMAPATKSALGSPWEDLSKVGHVFALERLVLISPDIPAEAAMSNRSNFIASSLRRFKEAYLFSNEADEVLRQISTTANFFSLPTLKHKFGYRLGNVGIVAEDYTVADGVNLNKLRIAKATLHELCAALALNGSDSDAAKSFAYFDCTYGIDQGSGGDKQEGVVSFAKPGRQKKISRFEHLLLLVAYIVGGHPDVHSGYFRSDFVKLLIYRLSCLGLNQTLQAYRGRAAFEAECRTHQLKIMLK